MSLLNANLPSSDEEDDDYDPTKDKTGEAEDRIGASDAKPIKKRKARRGVHAADEGRAEGNDDGDGPSTSVIATASAPPADEHDPRTQAKKAKIDAMWQMLNSKSQPSKATVSGAAKPVATSGSNGGSVNLASLCRQAGGVKANSDELWMRSLGMLPHASAATAHPKPATAASTQSQLPASSPGAVAVAGSSGEDVPFAAAAASTSNATATGSSGPSRPPVSEAARAAAAAALAAVKEGFSVTTLRNMNKVAVTETRKFAGKEIQVSVMVDKDSKEAQKLAEKAAARSMGAASGGMDAFLAEVEAKKKVSVLDKSKMDWQDAKKGDAVLEEELEAHKRSGAQYLDKKDFLKRAELREYESERDKRLAADMRTRGRL